MVRTHTLLQVEKVKVTRHGGRKSEPTGLMTIKATVDKQKYKIVEVIDFDTDKSYSLVQARRRGLIDLKTNEYVFTDINERISLEDAIEEGLVIVEFEEAEEVNNNETDDELETRTYGINYVVDQKRKSKVPFEKAIKRGLIDAKTGNYINNVTGEQIYLIEAIKQGLIKGSAVADAKALNVEARNQVAVEYVGKIKKYVINPLSVINAFRRAAEEVRTFS